MRKPFRVNVRHHRTIFLSIKPRPAIALTRYDFESMSEDLRRTMNPYQDSSFGSEPAEKIQEINDQNDNILDGEAAHLFPMTGEVTADEHRPAIPDLFTQLPLIRDSLETDTSLLQDETIQECLPCLAGISDSRSSPEYLNAHGLPRLERDGHIAYLHDSLTELPAAYVAYDASRPWIVYWALTGLCLLGEDVSRYRERY